MEPVGRSNNMGSNTNTTAANAVSATSTVVGLLLSPARPSAIANNPKTTGLIHSGNHRVPLQHCSSGSNVVHHQYSPILLPPPPAAVLICSTQTNSLLSSPPQLMLSTTATTTSGVVSHFQPHGNGSHQLVTASTVPVSATLPVMPNPNITSVGMALSPFGILPHERVVPHHTHHHRHQPKKLMGSSSSKTLLDPSSSNNPQILTTPVIHSQRFFIEPPSHLSNKTKQYDSIQQQHNRIKNVSDKTGPIVSSAYSLQSFEQRYQPRTPPQQVGYLSVITRTAVTTTNSVIMNEATPTNSNYYPAQPIPLPSKSSDNQDRQYYNFDSTASASQTPQQQLDNILLMGTPVQRGDPMHIVKNLQSMQTDIDCYGVKKMIEQQPRLLTTDNCKTIGSTGVLSNGSKTLTDHQHQHLQELPKSSVIDPSSTYNGQYFIRRQPPPAHLHQHQNQPHLQQHIVAGNSKMLPTPTPLSVVPTNGNTHLDVQQYQRHLRWNLDQQKQPVVSTSSCFSGNISSGVFHQPSLQQQQFNNVPSTFNVQPSTSSILQHQQQLSQPAHHNNFNVSSINPTYYNPAATIVSTAVTSVASTNSSLSLYSQPHHNNQPQHSNNFQDFSNNLQGGNYVANDDIKSPSLPHVMVPSIEQELSHLCDNPTTTQNISVKPFITANKKPSFLDSYIKFLRGGASCTTVEKKEKSHDLPKKLVHPISCSTPKPMPKPYIPLQKPKIVSVSEHITPTPNGKDGEDNKKIGNVTTTTDDDPRYFPLPKTSSSIAGISDGRSDGSNGGNSWLSDDDDQDQWWITSSKGSFNSATSIIKNKINKGNKKRKTSGKLNKKSTSPANTNKKQKTQHIQQPKRQLSHRIAKEKTQKLLNNIDGEDDDLLSEPNSDVDPAWIPNSDDNDAPKNCNSVSNRRSFSHKKFSKEKSLKSGHPPSTSSSINNNNNDQSNDSNVKTFKSGTFVALKSQYLDSEQTIPQQLWRVDGKSLLQKYKRCNEDNVYKSVSTYTGWNPSHYSMYRQVNVQFVPTYKGVKVVQKKSSTTNVLVQLISDDDSKAIKNNSIVNTEVGSSSCNPIPKSKTDVGSSVSSMNSADSAKDQDTMLRAQFDVYIQSLASQSLDPNFLVEIYRENDEYFLSNVRAIEKVTQTWMEAIDITNIKDLVTDLSNVENICTLIKRFPTMEMYTTDESSVHNIQLRCIVCGYQGFVDKQQKFFEISLSGTEYNNQTLKSAENNRPFSKIMPAKRVNCCSTTQCSEKVIILHSLEHLKYQLYQECCKRVTTENNNSKNKLTQDTTTVLNRLLADDEWIESLFQIVCKTWNRAKKFVSNDQ